LEKEFLTVKDLSDYLNLKRSKLYSLVESAQIPHFKIGHLIRFRRSEIDDWLESQRMAQKDHTNPKKEDFTKDPTVDIVSNIVEKAIEEVTGKQYTSGNGKPERVKGLRKEVEHVTQ
jgi:excisionase family DNA binding protein